jgi:hypothetical protein
MILVWAMIPATAAREERPVEMSMTAQVSKSAMAAKELVTVRAMWA